MSPTGPDHGAIEFNVAHEIRKASGGLGRVLVGEVGLYIRRDPDTVRAADVIFISTERYQRRAARGFLDVVPELIVEVLSPGDSWLNTTEKLRDYFSIGVAQVWVVNPDARSVFVYRSLTDVREVAEHDTLTAPDILPALAVNVSTLFAD